MARTLIIIRLELDHKKASFGDVAAAVSGAGGDITSIDVISSAKGSSVRDITVDTGDQDETAFASCMVSG